MPSASASRCKVSGTTGDGTPSCAAAGAALTAESAATLALTAESAGQLDALTLAAEGVGAENTGDVALALDALTLTSAASLALQGDAAIALAPATISAAASLALTGEASATLDPATLAAAGAGADNTGAVGVTLDAVTATGTAAHFRIYASDGTTAHLQGTVTATGGGGDMTVQNTSFASGQPFTVTGFTLTDGNA